MEFKTYFQYFIFAYLMNFIESAALEKEARESNIIESRLSLADWGNYNLLEPEGPGTYAFGYDIEDPETENTQFRNEERHPNGTVTGSYGYVMPDGNVQIVNYIADHLGYRANVEIKKRGYVKPIKVNVEEGILQALADVAAPSEKKIFKTSYLDQHVRPFDQDRKYFKQSEQFYHPYKMNENLSPQISNQKDVTYSISNNVAVANKPTPPLYRFYYIPHQI